MKSVRPPLKPNQYRKLIPVVVGWCQFLYIHTMIQDVQPSGRSRYTGDDTSAAGDDCRCGDRGRRPSRQSVGARHLPDGPGDARKGEEALSNAPRDRWSGEFVVAVSRIHIAVSFDRIIFGLHVLVIGLRLCNHRDKIIGTAPASHNRRGRSHQRTHIRLYPPHRRLIAPADIDLVRCRTDQNSSRLQPSNGRDSGSTDLARSHSDPNSSCHRRRFSSVRNYRLSRAALQRSPPVDHRM